MDVSPIVVDIETCGLPNAEDFLDPIPDAVLDDSPIEAAKNLTDPVKIAADIEKRIAARVEKNRDAQLRVEQQRIERIQQAALDWNVGRIVALAFWTESLGTQVRLCEGPNGERDALREFWEACRHRTIVGFNIKGFDLKFMVQRSRYLGVHHPILDFGKYSKGNGIKDLFMELTFNDGSYDRGCMRRTLHAFCKRFGIPINDDIKGGDVPALVAAGEWEKVRQHVESDLSLTVQLAHRLRVIDQIPIEAVL